MQMNDKNTTVTDSSAKTLIHELGATSNSTLLKKRSSRLMNAQIKKMGGGSPTQIANATSVSNIQDIENSSLPKRACVLAKSESIDKSVLSVKTTRKYNMRQPRVSRTRNSFSKVRDVLQDIESQPLPSPALRKGSSFRESKETLPPRTIDEEQEDEIIRLLELYQRKRLEEDPMRELDEALMDRTTASMNRRQKITSIKASTVFIEEKLCNSTTFVIRDIETSVLGGTTQRQDALSNDVTESEVSSNHQIENIIQNPDFAKKSVAQQLRNTLESGVNSVFDSGVIKRVSKGLDSCSTNATRLTATNGDYEEQCQEFQDALTPCTIKQSEFLNKRNLKSYQKKKLISKLHSKTQNNQLADLVTTEKIKTSRSQKLVESREQICDVSNMKEGILDDIQYSNGEKMIQTSIDYNVNLPHIKLEKDQIIDDTPQLIQSKYSSCDQNNNKPIDQILERNSLRYKHDLDVLNKLIRPMPYVPKNLINGQMQQNQKKKNKKMSRKGKRAAMSDEQFKRLSYKMIGLSNMLTLLNVTNDKNGAVQGLMGGVNASSGAFCAEAVRAESAS